MPNHTSKQIIQIKRIKEKEVNEKNKQEHHKKLTSLLENLSRTAECLILELSKIAVQADAALSSSALTVALIKLTVLVVLQAAGRPRPAAVTDELFEPFVLPAFELGEERCEDAFEAS